MNCACDEFAGYYEKIIHTAKQTETLNNVLMRPERAKHKFVRLFTRSSFCFCIFYASASSFTNLCLMYEIFTRELSTYHFAFYKHNKKKYHIILWKCVYL